MHLGTGQPNRSCGATRWAVHAFAGVLAAADVEAFTYTTTFTVMQSLRLDLGAGSQVHP